MACWSERWAAMSSSENTRRMPSIFSMPMPCSPEIVPPSATQACMISQPAACTRSS